MNTPLSATLTRDRHGQPLVALDGGPFNGLEIAPAALRELAGHLDALARLAVSRHAAGKHRRPLVVTVGHAQAVQAEQRAPTEPAKVGSGAKPRGVPGMSDAFVSKIFNDMYSGARKKGKK